MVSPQYIYITSALIPSATTLRIESLYVNNWLCLVRLVIPIVVTLFPTLNVKLRLARTSNFHWEVTSQFECNKLSNYL
jgi:formate hydrogenlyase subunit 4